MICWSFPTFINIISALLHILQEATFNRFCVLKTFFFGGGGQKRTERNRQNTPSITKTLIPKIRGVFSTLCGRRAPHVCRVTEVVRSGAAVMQTSGDCREKTLTAGQLHYKLSVQAGRGWDRGKSVIGSRKTSTAAAPSADPGQLVPPADPGQLLIRTQVHNGSFMLLSVSLQKQARMYGSARLTNFMEI